MRQKIGGFLIILVVTTASFALGLNYGLNKATDLPSADTAAVITEAPTAAPTADLTPFPAFLPTPIPAPEVMEVMVYIDGQVVSDDRLAEDGAHQWAPVIEWEYSLEYRLAHPDQPQKTRDFLASDFVTVPEGAESMEFVAHHGGFRLQSEVRKPGLGVPELVVLRYASR